MMPAALRGSDADDLAEHGVADGSVRAPVAAHGRLDDRGGSRNGRATVPRAERRMRGEEGHEPE
jgi:hypothetical protein